MLRPDAHGGIGVFATHAINSGVTLRLYDDSNTIEVSKTVPENTVPGEFIKYCVDEGGTVWLPALPIFSRTDLVWFLNHSEIPNAGHDEKYRYRAIARHHGE